MSLPDLVDLVHLALAESQGPPPSNGLWTSRQPSFLPSSPIISNYSPPAPLPRYLFGFCANKSGDIYFYGGDTGDQVDDRLYYYSTMENTITLLVCGGDSPGSRYQHAMTLVDNIIAIHGGVEGDLSDKDPSLFLLNLVSREWTRIASCGNAPGPRQHHAMAAIGTTIYIFGGYSDKQLNELWAFDLITLCTGNPLWELIEPPSQEQPPPRQFCTLVSYQNKLILFGGLSNDILDDVWSFDPKSRRWRNLRCTGNIPSPRYGHAATVLDDVMYVTCGSREGDSSNDVFALKVPELRWFKLENMDTPPIPRLWHANACIGTKIFVFGGDTQGRKDDLIHVLDTKYINNPDLHTLRRLMDFDIEFQVTLAREKLESQARELKRRLQVHQEKLGEVLSENLELEKRVTELDNELRRAKAKVQQLDIGVGEMQVHNSKLEERMTELEHDNNELKRSYIITSILESPPKMRSLAHLRGTDAQITVDFLAELLERQDLLSSNADRRRILHLLTKLAKSAQVFPKCAELPPAQCNLDSPVNDEGGYGLIYKGIFKQQMVCVKAVRVLDSGTNNATRVLRAQAGELALLAHVSHANIIPLYGAYLSSEAKPRICIVSPWMDNGDLSAYLRKFPNAARTPLMSDLAAGLAFLHDVGIVHADLKARNVLVSRSHRAMLADFGVSSVLTTNVGTTTAKDFSGTIFWMAPEQLIPDDEDELSPPTQQSDMWGFACIFFEALTGRIPFSPPYTPSQLVGVFIRGQATPLRPKRNGGPTITHGGPLVTLAEKCWNYDPSQRPTAAEALRFLTELDVQDERPSMDEELAMFKAAKNGRIEVKTDYTRLLSIFRKAK